MAGALRAQVLVILDAHSRTGSPEFKGDKDLALATQNDLGEIQRQLEILESEGLVSLAKAMGPTYGARITPAGMIIVERLNERGPEPPPGRPIGFHPG